MIAMPKVWIAGLGPGDAGMCTSGVASLLRRVDVVAGGARLLDAAEAIAAGGAGAGVAAAGCGAALSCGAGYDGTAAGKRAVRVEEIVPAKIRAALDNLEFHEACVVCSGDTGYYSLATSMRDALDGYEVETLPGIATVQVMAARLGRPWQGCVLRSAHGKGCNVVGEVLAAPEVFFLTGGDIVPRSIARQLDAAGLGFVEMAVGERLSYPSERIVVSSAAELVDAEFDSISSVWVRRPQLVSAELAGISTLSCGIDDDAFVRGKVPMTKQEVRACCMAKLGLAAGSVVYDVGAGTGSVSVEAALASPMNRVFAIEANPEGCELIERNRRRFGAYNIHVVPGLAPDVLDGLPSPDAAFVGGSKGNLQQIVEKLLCLNPACKVVATAIAVETLAEAQRVLGKLCDSGRMTGFEVATVNVSRTREAGSYHLMTAQNPVAIFSARGVWNGCGPNHRKGT